MMVATTQETKWLTVAEAAEYIRVAPSTLYRWRDEGRLVFYRFGPKNVRLKREDLDRLATPMEPEDIEEVRRRRRAWAREADAFREEIRQRFGMTDDSAVFLRQAHKEREAKLGGR